MTRSGHPATRAPGKRARRPRRIHGVAHERRLPGTGSARARAPTRAVQDEPSPPQHAARVRSQAGDVAIAEAPPQGAGDGTRARVRRVVAGERRDPFTTAPPPPRLNDPKRAPL